jgi:hypothetical protein
MPVNEIIELLISSYNNEAQEFDDLIDERDHELHEKNTLLSLIKDYEKGASGLLAAAEKSDQMLAQANRERDQAINKTKDLEIQLRAFKEIASTPKKVREKIKGFQVRIEKQKAAADQNKRNFLEARNTITALKVEVSELTNRLDAAGINQVYRSDNDIVQTYPYHLGDMIEGFDPKQTPLFYLHQSGRGGLVLLNDENEAQLVDAPKGGIRPKKSTLEHCGQWLRRAKSKNWELEKADIESLSHGS